jgi:hypothetical protein
VEGARLLTDCQAAGPGKGKGGGKGHVEGVGKGDGKGTGKASTALDEAMAEVELEMRDTLDPPSDGEDIDMMQHEHKCNKCDFSGRPNEILILDPLDWQGALTCVCCPCAVEDGTVKDATHFRRLVRPRLSLARASVFPFDSLSQRRLP